MFGKEPKVEAVKLDEIKQRLLDEMISYGPGTPEFTRNRKEFEKIKKLQKTESKQRPDSNTIFLGCVHLLGIVVIVAYEQKHVFASAAKNFIPKLKT